MFDSSLFSLDSLFYWYDGITFEDKVYHMLTAMDFTVTKTGGPNDNGIDMIARMHFNTDIIPAFALQIKAWNKEVTKSAVQEVFTGVHYYRASYIPVVFTISNVTLPTREFAKHLGVQIISKTEINLIVDTFRHKKISALTDSLFLNILLAEAAYDYKALEKILLSTNTTKPTPQQKEEVKIAKEEIITGMDKAKELLKSASDDQQRAMWKQQEAMEIQKQILLKYLDYG